MENLICNFTFTMKRLYVLLIMLVWVFPASSQELSDSTFWDAEMEDSISGMTIKPIKKPKKLLKAIIKQLSQNMEQKSGVRKYQIESVCNLNTSAPWTVRRNISAETGIKLFPTTEDDFSYEGPFKLTRQDSSYISFSLALAPNYSPVLEHIDRISRWQGQEISRFDAFNKLMNMYDVTVYSITDESGRGVYRVKYSPKKIRVTESNYGLMMYTYTGTAYFDSNTLRLTQVKAVRIRNAAPKVSLFTAKSDSSLASSASLSTNRERYQIDYDGSGAVPIVKQIKYVVIKETKVFSKTTIRRHN